jgi:hypothetical protein
MRKRLFVWRLVRRIKRSGTPHRRYQLRLHKPQPYDFFRWQGGYGFIRDRESGKLEMKYVDAV